LLFLLLLLCRQQQQAGAAHMLCQLAEAPYAVAANLLHLRQQDTQWVRKWMRHLAEANITTLPVSEACAV
jgi:hypothetical protein